MEHSLLVHGLEKLLKAGDFSSLTMDPAALLGTDDEAEEDEDSSGGKEKWENGDNASSTSLFSLF